MDTQPVKGIDTDIQFASSDKKSFFHNPKKVLFLVTIALLALPLLLGYFVFLQRNNNESVPMKNATVLFDSEQEKSVINDGEIYFIKENKLYWFDSSIHQEKQLAIVPEIQNIRRLYQLGFSRDGNYMSVNVDTDKDTSIIIYDLLNKKSTVIKGDPEKAGPNPRIEDGHISPNNKYFIGTTSCCIGDVGRGVFDINGNLIKQLTGGMVLWSPNGSQFVMSKESFHSPVLPIGSGLWDGSLYLEAVDTAVVTEKLLLKANGQLSYTPVAWIDDRYLIYKQIAYSQPFPENASDEEVKDEELQKYWMNIYDHPTITYWKIDLTTLQTREMFGYQKPKSDTATYSPNKKWKIVQHVEEGKGQYILINDANTVKIALDAQEALWRPTGFFYYKNNTLGFSIMYPSDLVYRETSYETSFMRKHTTSIFGYEVVLEPISNMYNDFPTFEENIRSVAFNFCAASGPMSLSDGSVTMSNITCPKENITVQKFQNKNKVEGYKVMRKVEAEAGGKIQWEREEIIYFYPLDTPDDFALLIKKDTHGADDAAFEKELVHIVESFNYLPVAK